MPISIVKLTGGESIIIPGVAGYEPTGAEMSGMEVTVEFENGLIETLTWQATGADSGGVASVANPGSWTLSASGDTFSAAWTMFINGLSDLGMLMRLVLDGTSAGVMFDCTSPTPGTDGSLTGADFAVLSGGSFSGTATYDYPAVVTGAGAPVGDLFHRLTVEFSTFLGPYLNWTFRLDSDVAAPPADPDPSPWVGGAQVWPAGNGVA